MATTICTFERTPEMGAKGVFIKKVAETCDGTPLCGAWRYQVVHHAEPTVSAADPKQTVHVTVVRDLGSILPGVVTEKVATRLAIDTGLPVCHGWTA